MFMVSFTLGNYTTLCIAALKSFFQGLRPVSSFPGNQVLTCTCGCTFGN